MNGSGDVNGSSGSSGSGGLACPGGSNGPGGYGVGFGASVETDHGLARRTAKVAGNDGPLVDSIVHVSADAFVEVDGEGRIVRWNDAAEDLLGWKADEVMGTLIKETAIPARFRQHYDSSILYPAVRAVRRNGKGMSSRKMMMLRRDGSEIEVSVRAYAVRYGEEYRIGGFMRDIGREASVNQALADAYLSDGLTGLPNRARLMYELTYALAERDALRGDAGLAVVAINLDGLGSIRNAYGAEVVDEVMLAAAGRLVSVDAGVRMVGRYWADNFLAILASMPAPVDGAVDRYVEVVAEAFSSPVLTSQGEVFVTPRFGVAVAAPGDSVASDLISRADSAVRHAGEANTGPVRRVVFGEVMRREAVSRIELDTSLRKAVELQQFRVLYQPIVDIGGQLIVGVEALVRWRHPDRGVIVPDDFVPLAEENGLIVPIGTWVLEEVCANAGVWDAADPTQWCEDHALGVNISARQLDHPDIGRTVKRVLRETGLSPGRLTLEITESAVMRDPGAAMVVLGELKELGVAIAVDDFGTGYSSLAYLERLPVDILKIDKSFVQDLGSSKSASHLVKAMVDMAHALDMLVIGEGVETRDQLSMLKALGCDLAQGFLFAVPSPPELLLDERVALDSVGADSAPV